MKITVDKSLGTPLYWQISNRIRELILTGQLTDRAILPSERALAEMAGVHRNTVIKAYSVLRDWELVESIPAVGYIVSFSRSGKTGAGQRDARKQVNWSNLIKDEYQDMEKTFDDIFQRFSKEDAISLSTGMPPAVYDEKELAVHIASILSEKRRNPLFLSPYQGDMNLRRQIIAYLRTKGIRAGMSEVQIMSETNQALDFIVTALLKEGDSVIIEEPVSPDVYRVIELAGCSHITVPVDGHGMVCERLEEIVTKHKPKFIYVNSSYHDPTGAIMSLKRREKLLEISAQYRLPIIEEDAMSELSFGDNVLPSLKSMDTNGNVIYIYSFSMTFIPGMSMAFVVAPSRLVESLSYLVSIRVMTLDWLTQRLLEKYMAGGTYREKLSDIVESNKSKCDLMCTYLDALSETGVKYQKPRGGIYIWCKLPPGVKSKEVVAETLRRGVSVVPGEVFYPERNDGYDRIRINFSYETEERIAEGMEILTDVIKELTMN